MSKLFFDHLISFEEVNLEITKSASSKEEQEELWQLVDEMIHHRVLGYILGKLSQESHEEFLTKFHSAPYDEGLFDYLKEKIGQNVEELVRQELGSLAFEILEEIGSQPAKKSKKK
jgi:hypothetical protein